jgi:UDP-glucose 4-epimerase
VGIVVTGGAGYIGAHVVRLLERQGRSVTVVDDLSNGEAGRIGAARLVQLDIADPANLPGLGDALRGANAVIHFAAKKQVGESVAQPAHYYQQNIGGLANLLNAMEKAGVGRLVFSSSAAVYGMPDLPLISEDAPTAPLSPYGETKLAGEWLVAAAARAWGMRAAALRYFNVAGAGWGDLADSAILNLVPMVLDRLADGRAPRLFGADYPTPDGTCVRDYIHVLDLAEAHLAALDYLDRDDRPDWVFNVGTGQGASVREVLAQVARVSGLDTTPSLEPPRAGDPARVVADPGRIARVMGWRASRGLAEIVESAWNAWQAGPRAIR